MVCLQIVFAVVIVITALQPACNCGMSCSSCFRPESAKLLTFCCRSCCSCAGLRPPRSCCICCRPGGRRGNCRGGDTLPGSESLRETGSETRQWGKFEISSNTKSIDFKTLVSEGCWGVNELSPRDSFQLSLFSSQQSVDVLDNSNLILFQIVFVSCHFYSERVLF